MTAADPDLDVVSATVARLQVTARSNRGDGRLFGGTAVTAAIALGEAATDRRCVWTTVQFVASAQVGDTLDCAVEVLAAGRRTSQFRVTGRLGGRTVFAAMGATAAAAAGAAAAGLDGQFEPMPDVPPPARCAPFALPVPPGGDPQADFPAAMELRLARPHTADRPLALWGRVPGRVATPAVLGFLGDCTLMPVVHATGHLGGGTSLDNTLRVAAPATSEWVLIEPRPHFAAGGFGSGSAAMWSADGVLAAVASQSGRLSVFEPPASPNGVQ